MFVPVNIFTFFRRLINQILYKSADIVKRPGRGFRPVILAAILVVAICFIYVHLFKDYNSLQLSGLDKQDVTEYCNFPLDTSGEEGSLDDTKDLSLESVQVLIRHGDRATAKLIKGFEIRNFHCSTNPKHGKAKKLFEGYHKVVERFSQIRMTKDASSHYLTSYSEVCETGGLTQKGFLQHFELGQHLRSAYSQLHIGGIGKKHLYVRSTNYDRTVQSAASFLYGFLDLDTMEKGVVLNISTDPFFRENEDGTVDKCSALAKRREENKNSPEYVAGSNAMEPIMEEVAALLMVDRESLPPVNYVADYGYVFSCQGLTLPCGQNGCLSKNTFFKLMAHGNWAFTHNYTLAISQLLSYPLLAQIATRMAHKTEGKSSNKFGLYSGHDSTITAILSFMGVYEKKWMRYASRLVFELWKDKKIAEENITDARDYKGWFLRVLFNGKVVTGKLAFCTGKVARRMELCPLDYLISWLSRNQGLSAIGETYKELCNE